MDDKKLKKILDEAEITPDINAKKRAVNLAMSEFQTHQHKKQKNSPKFFQGSSFLSRLMGKTTNNRRDPMEKLSNKRMLQGTAVLMAGVAFIALPIAFQQTQSTLDSGTQVYVAPEMTEAPASNYTSPITEVNEADVEQAIAQGNNALPVPIEPPIGIIALPEESKEREEKEPLQRGRKQQLKKDRANIATADMAAAPPARIMSKQMAAEGFARSAVMPMPADDNTPSYYKDEGRDKFEDFKINPIKVVAEEPVSTFSSDVDTASYSFVRRQLNNGQLPQKDAIRIEEIVNYFDYNYPLPETREQPFKPTVTLVDSPWAEGKKLMQIGIKGFDIEGKAPKSNLVFLLDVSGSMNSPDKLPLLKNSLKLVLEKMGKDDTVSIVTYAGATRVVLEPTPASEKSTIINALENLNAGGGTAGAAGIELAYQQAEQNFDPEAVNRVILATDGDFNVGITSHEELQDFIERKRDGGIFLSVLGFGQGNYNDQMMQTLAQNGNGVAAYIDNLNEARKVLVEEASSTLFPIAKDVKIQVEFNPVMVAEYRLIGYETRALNREDFNNDKVDAGDIGAGHTVTAIYEITPVGSEAVSIDPLRYDTTEAEKAVSLASSAEYAFVKLRYKLPNEDTSKLITTPVTQENVLDYCPEGAKCNRAPLPDDVEFATAVVAFGQILKGGEYTGNFNYDDVIALAQNGKGDDEFGYRAEFIQMVRLAKSAATMPPR